MSTDASSPRIASTADVSPSTSTSDVSPSTASATDRTGATAHSPADELGRGLVAALTPSDVVLIDAAAFVPRAGLKSVVGNNVSLVRGDGSVSAATLTETMIAAALLADEAADALRLVPERTSRFFGLTHPTTVFVEPGDGRPNWPDMTLEATIAHAVADRGERVELDDLLCELFDESSNAPATVVSLVEASLASRGVLDSVEKKSLLGTTTRYVLGDEVSRLDTDDRIDEVRALLAILDTDSDRPELRKHVSKRITSAMSRLTESDDDGDWGAADFDGSFD